MKIAACYIRVSTDDQLEYSPDSQLEKIRDYAKRNEMILPNEFVFIEEEGVSGRKAEKRHEFQRMIGIAKTKPKPFDAILLWKFSRFARNREDSIVYKSMLRKQLGIDVISISENVGDDKMAVLIEAMIEAMDEYYSINLAEEVKRGMTEKARRGEAVSIAPFGYTLVNKKLVVKPEQAEIVKTVFEKYCAGVGLRAIATWLNGIGVRTNRGNPIENRTVEYWLNNPVYHGYIRWTPTGRIRRDYHNPDSLISQGSHEPIIGDELWEKTQECIAENKALYSKYRRTHDETGTYSLIGVLRCSNCLSTLTRSNGVYLQCCSYAKGACKTSMFIKMEDAEMLLISALTDDIQNAHFNIAPPDKAPDIASEADIVRRQLGREASKLERARQAYLSGADSVEEYAANKRLINDEIEKLSSRLSELTAAVQEAPINACVKQNEALIAELLDANRTPIEKNKAAKTVIKTAILHRNPRKIDILYFGL